eukprot:SAG22_NODE_48_length_24654_cov_4.406394_9_plen_77_part_00
MRGVRTEDFERVELAAACSAAVVEQLQRAFASKSLVKIRSICEATARADTVRATMHARVRPPTRVSALPVPVLYYS